MLVKRVSRGHDFFAEFLAEVMQKLPSFSPTVSGYWVLGWVLMGRQQAAARAQVADLLAMSRRLCSLGVAWVLWGMLHPACHSWIGTTPSWSAVRLCQGHPCAQATSPTASLLRCQWCHN
jgi:hypothetical protein